MNTVKFNQAQLKKQTERAIEFLKLIHPHLSEGGGASVELRVVKPENTGDDKFYRSYNTWKISKEDERYIYEFFEHINGAPVNLYYSVFTFDKSMECCDLQGKKLKRGKVNKQNSKYCTCLVADFDDISVEEFDQRYRVTFDKLDLEFIMVSTGHGVQIIFLLTQRCYDKEILAKFTDLLTSRGFAVDQSCRDSARVMRMPYSFNCKNQNSEHKDYGQAAVPVKIISSTLQRYTVDHILDKIQSLPVVKEVESLDNMFEMVADSDLTTIPFYGSDAEIKVSEEARNIEIATIETKYKNALDLSMLDDNFLKILNGAPEGLRNECMLFLIPYFRKKLGLSKPKVKEVLTVWGSLCTPPISPSEINQEVERLWAKDKCGAYTKKLAAHFGFLDLQIKISDKVIIPNEFFNDMSALSDCCVKIYLSLKLAMVENLDKNNFTADEIAKISKISKRTFERNIDELCAAGYISRTRGSKKAGKTDQYYINPYYNKTLGFLILPYQAGRRAIEQLTDGEIKLYLYIYHLAGAIKQGECITSQKYLADQIGKKGQSAISGMSDVLHKKKFIRKETETLYGTLKKTTYTLYI